MLLSSEDDVEEAVAERGECTFGRLEMRSSTVAHGCIVYSMDSVRHESSLQGSALQVRIIYRSRHMRVVERRTEERLSNFRPAKSAVAERIRQAKYGAERLHTNAVEREMEI